MSKPNRTKICRVCGDKALGFNFQGLSCESCKSFYRRNIFKYESIVCHKGNRCHIDMFTRKICTKCRIDKCIRIGMKRSLVFSRIDGKEAAAASAAATAAAANQKTVAQKLSSSSTSSTASSSSFSTSFSSSPLLETSSASEDILLADLPLTSTVNDVPSIDLLIDGQIESTLVTLMSEDHHIDFLAEPTLPLPRQLYCLELNPLELDHIQEIQLACRASTFYDENRLQLIGEAADLVYALNLAEPYVKKTIKFIKNIAAFRQLNQDVQLTMLKSFFTELLLIRFAFVFDQEKDGFTVFENESCNKAVLIRLNIIYEAKRHNMLLACRHYSSEFHEWMESDSILRNLIIVQRLFQPNDAMADCSEYIRYQYTLYTRLLHRYLENKYYNAERASGKMARLSAILTERMPQIKSMLEGIFTEFTHSSQLALVLGEMYQGTGNRGQQ